MLMGIGVKKMVREVKLGMVKILLGVGEGLLGEVEK